MDYEIQFYESLKEPQLIKQVWNILCECDKDFYPPLSSRESTYQTANLLQSTNSHSLQPVSYFEELKKQHFLLFKDCLSERIIGFLSFKHFYQSEETSGYNPSNYITTTCVLKEYRNLGVGKKLYDFFESNLDEKFRLRYITRRTWSTNDNQLHLYEKLNYTLICTLENHRGKGIHTVYFGKELYE